nr:hypothetical protein [Mycobacterium lepraemurium]
MDDTARRGSGLALLSLLCVGLLAGGLAIGVAMGGVMPLPYGPVAAVAAYVRAQPDAVRVIAVATFASSVPLALYAATAATRLRHLGASPTTAAITLTGGTLAAGLLALAGLLGWTLSWPAVTADTAVVAALYLLVFLIGGGRAHRGAGRVGRRDSGARPDPGVLPKSVARAGLATAALAGSATAVLIWPALGVILPVARVASLTWLLVAVIALQDKGFGDPGGRAQEGAST